MSHNLVPHDNDPLLHYPARLGAKYAEVVELGHRPRSAHRD